MNLSQIGKLVRTRRLALGLSQEQLSRLSDLSRVTINQLENNELNDIGFKKLENILNILGVTMETSSPKKIKNPLVLASRTASTSYKEVLTPIALKKILQTGDVPPKFAAHIMALLDETPTSIVLGAVKEAANDKVSVKNIMAHLAKWADEWKTNRQIWA